jgi:hypothetical protein
MLVILLQLGLLLHMIENFSSLPSRFCIKNTMDSPMFFHLLCKKLCIIQMFVFGGGVSKDETCFEQVLFLILFS